MARKLPAFTDDSLQRIAAAVRSIEARIGNLERRLAARTWQYEDHFKPFCRFELSEALTTTDDTCAATILAQYGPGVPHPSDEITLINLLTDAADYEFYGAEGATGWAAWTGEGTDWILIIPQCPST